MTLQRGSLKKSSEGAPILRLAVAPGLMQNHAVDLGEGTALCRRRPGPFDPWELGSKRLDRLRSQRWEDEDIDRKSRFRESDWPLFCLRFLCHHVKWGRPQTAATPLGSWHVQWPCTDLLGGHLTFSSCTLVHDRTTQPLLRGGICMLGSVELAD